MDGGRCAGIARRAYSYTYTTHVRTYTYARARPRASETESEKGRGATRREGAGEAMQGAGEGLRETRGGNDVSGRRKGGQVTPPRAALAAGEITAPSLLARDVHKLCITASGAHVSEPRGKTHGIARARSPRSSGGGSRVRRDAVSTRCPLTKGFNSYSEIGI